MFWGVILRDYYNPIGGSFREVFLVVRIWISDHQEDTPFWGIFQPLGNFRPLGRYPIFGYLPSGWNREFPTTRKIPRYGVSS